MLIATPFLLALLQPKFKRHYVTPLPTIAVCSVLFVSVALTTKLYNQETYSNAIQIAKRETSIIENSLLRNLNLSQITVQSLASQIQSTPTLSQQEFDSYSANYWLSIHLLKHFHGIAKFPQLRSVILTSSSMKFIIHITLIRVLKERHYQTTIH